MKRSGFKPRIKPRPVRDRSEEFASHVKEIPRRGTYASAAAALVKIPKDNPLRSETYRRLVASLPCYCCKVEGYSQAAHPPPIGKSIKQDDRLCFPMCCTRPGVVGCHVSYDQYKLMPVAQARVYAYIAGGQTRDAIERDGLWPDDLPKLKNFIDMSDISS